MALVLEVAFVVEDAEGEGSGLGLHDAFGLEQGFDWLEEGGPEGCFDGCGEAVPDGVKGGSPFALLCFGAC